jgi:hypothetical protein
MVFCILVSATTTRIYIPEKSVLSALVWKQPNNLKIGGGGVTAGPQHKSRGGMANGIHMMEGMERDVMVIPQMRTACNALSLS